MNPEEIKDVLALRDILVNAENTATLISALIVWRDSTSLATIEYRPVTQQDHSAAEEAVAKVETATKPVKAPAKSRAKPPRPEPTPDPSSDDDF